MNNPQRFDRLLVLTQNIPISNQIVAQSNESELAELDDFLNEYIDIDGDKLKKNYPKPVFVAEKGQYSIFTVETKEIHGKNAYLLKLVSGVSPMNWSPVFFDVVEEKVNFGGKSIFMQLYKDPEDSIYYPVR